MNLKTKHIIIIGSLFLLACGFFIWNKMASTKEYNPYKDVEMKAVIISSENNTFGYDIYLNEAILIHQPSRPGLPGNAGFAKEEDAMTVAKLVIEKIRNNELPPTVTIQELQELGVL